MFICLFLQNNTFFCKNAFCNRRTIFNLTFCLKTCLPQFSSWPVSLKPWLPCFLCLWWCRGLCRGRTFFWWRWILSFWSCLIISFVSCSLASGPSTINLDFSSVSSSLVSASGWFDSFPVNKKETCHYIIMYSFKNTLELNNLNVLTTISHRKMTKKLSLEF